MWCTSKCDMKSSHPSCVEQGPPRAMHSLAWVPATKSKKVWGVRRRPSSKNTKSTSCFVVREGLVHILKAQNALSIQRPLPKLGVNQSDGLNMKQGHNATPAWYFQHKCSPTPISRPFVSTSPSGKILRRGVITQLINGPENETQRRRNSLEYN